MRIFAAFDKFKDSFSAQKASDLLAQAVNDCSFSGEVTSCAFTDGGEGFSKILAATINGKINRVNARNSLGETKATTFAIVSIKQLSHEVRELLNLPQRGKLAIVEMASVCGLSELTADQRNPWKTTSLGVGELLLAAKQSGADYILLGIGGSSTNDMGIGALCSLGLKIYDSNKEELDFPSPEFWSRVASFDGTAMESLPPIRIACDVDNPLLGLRGATHQFGPQKGLKDSVVEELEQQMSSMEQKLRSQFPNSSIGPNQKGAGAAGGIGYGLSLQYQVKFVAGAELVSKWMQVEQAIKRADVVFCGEGRFDHSSMGGKGPFEIIRLAAAHKKPTVLICGSIEDEMIKNLSNLNPLLSHRVLANPNLNLEQNLSNGPNSFLRVCKESLMTLQTVKSEDCPIERDLRFKRIKRLKKFLRPLPRRSNIHRYPVLKWFADTAYKRSYLWSFRGKEIRAALFFGIWISMLPIVGIQMLVVFFFALLIRANLPLIVALQWISNPLTMGPIYFADYKIGMVLLDLLGFNYPRNKLLNPNYDWTHFTYKELLRLIDTFPPMLVGGSVLGISLGVIAVFLYKILCRFYR